METLLMSYYIILSYPYIKPWRQTWLTKPHSILNYTILSVYQTTASNMANQASFYTKLSYPIRISNHGVKHG